MSQFLDSIVRVTNSQFRNEISAARRRIDDRREKEDRSFWERYLGRCADDGLDLPMGWQQFDEARLFDLAAFVFVSRKKFIESEHGAQYGRQVH